MDTIGSRELRQHASDYVERAEAGETLLITVSGRPAAVLGPVSKQWTRYSDIEDVFDTPTDHTSADDLGEKNDMVHNPWTR
ncbi:type II toxin-antitoxin system prevent-host-death family antitoxin [Rhodococcus sp. BP-349]|uniref:type II toxin-antitoxin system Phd/YefM family antitoxin n=1 Tax=unclassified Rhodococcus (in: high G+C Gram-positive bacteria) TaxID=192944 RepID=UPI001C9B55EC|nr:MULTISPECIES: type II toxin-antitoxin system prevent-host-death family antitoxin [unclassified Rhodococcus (in: high G+C Gram-positive bacteria)]MBY6540075.1 type II toxin-antitoxin system prevent-host-death family antitoxin [Rhodococcus sp. BP-363]MBY6543597.1 type II toxin-antitoxin system prevent-host-death family antitoxin [Rhodococcus sp. BP-369]MBY6562827.1 type II toxin-antitoxin system prevent-host-death family antitoxin [Rhodococcus sp. BP-370]MBY6577119.1 type II toxin-antitoxin sy